MLVAVNKDTNEKIVAYEKDISYLKDISKRDLVICPECGMPLTFNEGKIKTSYFSHRKNNNCTYPYWEPESLNHIRAKLELMRALKKIYINSIVELEYKVNETNQRADVMVIHPNGEKWAFEVQLSKISLSTFIERSNLYAKAGVIDFWLVEYNLQSVYWKSSEKRYGEQLKKFIDKFYGIDINEKILIEGKEAEVIDLDSILVKKENKNYKIKSKNEYKKEKENLESVKNLFKNHLEKVYYKTQLDVNYKINISESIDILMSSKRGKIAFNFISENLYCKDISKRQKIYKEFQIPVFWIYVEYKKEICAKKKMLEAYENCYGVLYNKNYCTVYEIIKNEGPAIYGFELDDMVIKKCGNEFTLEEKEEPRVFVGLNETKVYWRKFANKWTGVIYNCYQKKNELVTTTSIEECKRCPYFGRYDKNKKVVICKKYK